MHHEPMTEYGYNKLKKELDFLKDIERPNIVKDIEVARSYGDLKENAEYHAAKDRQAVNESKIVELTKIITKAQIIDPAHLTHQKVSFGSTVRLLNIDTDEEIEYTIVGVTESNPERKLVSYHSPLARAMIGKEEGDDIMLSVGKNVIEYEVLQISYKPINFGD